MKEVRRTENASGPEITMPREVQNQKARDHRVMNVDKSDGQARLESGDRCGSILALLGCPGWVCRFSGTRVQHVRRLWAAAAYLASSPPRSKEPSQCPTTGPAEIPPEIPLLT